MPPCSLPPPRPRPAVEALEGRRLLAVLPPGFVDTLVASGLERPVSVDFTPDGRLFVTEQAGRVRVIRDGALLPEPFVTLDVSSGGERGALGIAVDPEFASNGYIYVFHTARQPNIHNRVSRFTAAGDRAAAGSEQVIFDGDRLDAGSLVHNGGDVKFGADGKLYLSTGENGSAGRAQSLDTTHGKIIRVNPDGSIPEDNPFYAATTGNNRAIWALGLRNPYTFDVDGRTGRLFINDVGAASWEEINEGVAGGNYGWPREEGPNRPGADPQHLTPLFAYGHGSREVGLDKTDEPLGASITGGTFYDPPAGAAGLFPADLADDYFFVDGTNQWIWRLDPQSGEHQRFAGRLGPAMDIETGPDGSLYYVAWGQGEVRRISYAGLDTAPTITRPPAAQSTATGQPVTFTVEVSGAEPLMYQWRRDGVAIDGASSPAYSFTATAADNGAAFDVVVSNPQGSATSSSAPLAVTDNEPPTATILTPAEGKLYRAGQRLKFKGAGTDADAGKLPARAFTWEVIFHHAEHTHPFSPAASGKRSGSVLIPRGGETWTDVWYRILLTVTDSQGLSTTAFRDVHPQTVTIAVDGPAGAEIALDGQPMAAPFSFTSVAGMRRELSAPLSQQIEGLAYAFAGWKGSRSPVLNLATPAKDRTFTVVYVPARQ